RAHDRAERRTARDRHGRGRAGQRGRRGRAARGGGSGADAPEGVWILRGSPGARIASQPMSYFQAVRLYSVFELCIFSALVITWVAGLSDHLQLILGWCHGFGWIALCIAIGIGCMRRVFPWPVLAAAVSPL